MLLDLDDGTNLSWLMDTLVVSTQDTSNQGGGTDTTTPYTTQLEERYGGMRTDWEQRSNGTLSWSVYVTGASSTVLAQNIRALLTQIESAAKTYVERCDPGWPSSLFYERRGPGSWTQSMYDPIQCMAQIDCQIPIAPAALGTAVTTTAAITSPGMIALPAIPGNIPALVDVALDLPATPLSWAMLAPSGPSGAVFGWLAPTVTAGLAGAADATARAGNRQQVNPMVANTTYSIGVAIDPSTVMLEDFEDDVALEVWVRLQSAQNGPVGAVLATYATPPGNVGAIRRAVDFPQGRPLTTPAPAGWRYYRAGVIRLPSEPGSGQWTVVAQVVPGVGSGGVLAFDSLLLVPARHRAALPTGVTPGGSSYPYLLASTAAAQTRTYTRDGRGKVSLIAGVAHQDAGIGGAPLRVPPGASGQLLAVVSPNVPDDPSSTAPADALTNLTAHITVTPRYSLLSTP